MNICDVTLTRDVQTISADEDRRLGLINNSMEGNKS